MPSGPDAFEDDDGNVHERNVNALAAADLVAGVGDPDGDGRPEFRPRAVVTRAQMATFIARVHDRARGDRVEAVDDAFTDDDRDPHEHSINALAAVGVVRGVGITQR